MPAVLAAITVIAAPTARAAPEAPAPAADPQQDAAMARSKALHGEGRSAYELTDYATALEKFSAAYTELPVRPDTKSIRAAIVYNVGITQLRIFELDGDIVHLRRAQVLLNKYLDDYTAAEGVDARTSESTKKERDLLAQIDDELVKAEAVAAARAAPAEPDPVAADPPAEAPITDTEPAKRKANILIGVGGASLGLGVVGLSLFGAGAALGRRAENAILDNPDANMQRPQDLADGRSANTLTIAGAIAGGVFTTAGVALLAVGLLRRKRARGGSRLSVAPLGHGVALGGRF